MTVDSTPPMLAVEPDRRRRTYASPTPADRPGGGRDGPDCGRPAGSARPRRRVLRHAAHPPGTVHLVARDAAGNNAAQDLVVPTRPPGACAASTCRRSRGRRPSFASRSCVSRAEHQIDTVQLDIKDEDGIVGYDSQIPLARQAGASGKYYDAKAAMDTSTPSAPGGRPHRGLPRPEAGGLGRAERARWTWSSRTPRGGAVLGRQLRRRLVHELREPRRHRVQRRRWARKRAKLGFDEIMYDYIRKPEHLGQVYKGIGDRTPSQAIVDFVKVASEPHPRERRPGPGPRSTASPRSRPELVAQDIPAMAKHLDYIAPMVYPSHWGPGEYSVANPNRSRTRSCGARSRDFGSEGRKRHRHPDHAVAAGLLARRDLRPGARCRRRSARPGTRASHSFLLWNAAARYTRAALPPRS